MKRPVVVLAALVVVLTLAAGVGVAVHRSSSSAPAPTSTTSMAAPSAPVTEEPSPPPPGPLDDVLPGLQAFVERERGLAFKGPVRVAVLEERAFADRAVASESEDAEELANTQAVLHAMGLLSRDVDLKEAVDRFLEASVLGFYDPETDELVVRGSRVTPLMRTTLVHELVHALEDQHFDLHREDLGDEALTGFTALIEGSALRVAAYADPPASSEQVLDPRRYLRADKPKEVAVPKADGKPFDDGEIGALYLILMLDLELGTGRALEAAVGWGGDRYVAWRDGPRTCVRMEFVMDSPRDTAQLVEALRDWAGRRGGRTTASGTTLTTCG